jgi:hypothetical protein
MSDVTETEQPVVETPSAPDPAPAPQDDLDRLLAEYEQNTAKPEPEQTPEPNPSSPVSEEGTGQTLDQLLALSTDPKIAQLEGELAGVRSEADRLRAEQHRQQEWAAFQDYAKSLQEQLPPHLPDGYAELKLKALAHDPTIAQAFDYRNVDRQAASAELAKVQMALAHTQRMAGADPTRVQQLNEYANKLQIAVNSQAILRKARLDILNEANKLPPPIDPEATQVRNDVAWALKSASSAKKVAEPPPNFGRMSENEFRNWKRENLGWE